MNDDFAAGQHTAKPAPPAPEYGDYDLFALNDIGIALRLRALADMPSAA